MLWAAWHGTEYFTPTFARVNGGLTLSGVSVFLLAAICFSIIIAWVFNNTGGSVFMAILLRASINFPQGVTSDLFPAAGFNEVRLVLAFSLCAPVVVAATRGRLGYRPATPEHSAPPASHLEATTLSRGGPDAV